LAAFFDFDRHDVFFLKNPTQYELRSPKARPGLAWEVGTFHFLIGIQVFDVGTGPPQKYR
jgi:hypothetical protein